MATGVLVAGVWRLVSATPTTPPVGGSNLTTESGLVLTTEAGQPITT